ncbi:EAL domain-containing protein [Methyloceanibacter sp.]|uniref:EAL domain-containing protein n=1 Tax=Methyloceanibacter sp. TaxID=1965321 RepID=UPI003C71EB23
MTWSRSTFPSSRIWAVEKDETLVQTLVELAQSFGLATVGEWVSDALSVELLKKAGVSYLQGDFFGAPEL